MDSWRFIVADGINVTILGMRAFCPPKSYIFANNLINDVHNNSRLELTLIKFEIVLISWLKM